MNNSRLKELIEAIDKETDAKKALALITQLNELLEEKTSSDSVQVCSPSGDRTM